MDLEKKYYENKGFWTQQKFSKQDAERFRKVLTMLPQDISSILDVGSGNGEFLSLLNNAVDGRRYSRLCGVDSSKAALEHVTTEKYFASIEELPFKNEEFDLVTCLEVIEHLPMDIFDRGLDELVRVSKRYILISTPLEENLLINLVACPRCESRFNHDYHKRTLNETDLNSSLNRRNCKHLKTLFEGLYREYWAVSKLYNSYRGLFPRRLPAGYLCPVCGYLPDTNTARVDDVRKTPPRTVYKIAKALIPSKTKNYWMLALYEKD